MMASHPRHCSSTDTTDVETESSSIASTRRFNLMCLESRSSRSTVRWSVSRRIISSPFASVAASGAFDGDLPHESSSPHEKFPSFPDRRQTFQSSAASPSAVVQQELLLIPPPL